MPPLRKLGFCLFLPAIVALVYLMNQDITSGNIAYDIPIELADEAKNPSLTEFWSRNAYSYDANKFTSIQSRPFYLSPDMNPIEISMIVEKKWGTTVKRKGAMEESVFTLSDENEALLWAYTGATVAWNTTKTPGTATEKFRLQRFNVDSAKHVTLRGQINNKIISGSENTVIIRVRARIKTVNKLHVIIAGLSLFLGGLLLAVTYKSSRYLSTDFIKR